MKRVCLDNNILIWGVRRKATAGQEDHIDRAQTLFDELDENGAQIIVPTPVLSEFLSFAPLHRHTEITANVQRHFQLTPFDAHAAAIAARLWRERVGGSESWKEELRLEVPGLTHARIKYDVQILATALSRHADILYTHDKNLTKLAQGKIEVRELPPLPPKQGDLFENEPDA